MTKKIIMGFTLMLILIVPAMSLHASAQTSQSYTITGAGSTFVFPLMDNWRVEYNKINPNISSTINQLEVEQE